MVASARYYFHQKRVRLRFIPTISFSPLGSCLFPFLFPFYRLCRLYPYLCPWRPFLLYLYLSLCPWPPVQLSDIVGTDDQATRRTSIFHTGLKKVNPRRGASWDRQQAAEAEAGNRESVRSIFVVSSAEQGGPFFEFRSAWPSQTPSFYPLTSNFGNNSPTAGRYEQDLYFYPREWC